MIDHNHFICHFIFGGHLLNIPIKNYFPFFIRRRGNSTSINIWPESGS